MVAGGEPGAERFGRLVQRLRKENELSVDRVAASADLSVGTIRAIEQGRRAPSEESGVRLLKLLLPASAVKAQPTVSTDAGQVRADFVFSDPETGREVLVEFKAKTAGDNRRWASDKAPAQETTTEARIRELLTDPDYMANWRREFGKAMAPTIAVLEKIRGRVGRPASHADYGAVVRRLAGADEFDLECVGLLLDIRERARAGTADERARNQAIRLMDVLNETRVLPDEDRGRDSS